MTTATSPTGVSPNKPGWYIARWHADDEYDVCLEVENWGGVLYVADGERLLNLSLVHWWGPSLSSLLATAARVPELEAERDEAMRDLVAERLRRCKYAENDRNAYTEAFNRWGEPTASRLFPGGTPPSPSTEKGPT